MATSGRVDSATSWTLGSGLGVVEGCQGIFFIKGGGGGGRRGLEHCIQKFRLVLHLIQLMSLLFEPCVQGCPLVYLKTWTGYGLSKEEVRSKVSTLYSIKVFPH